ncbi:MAG TPA: WD40 repeat domain-containing protein [Gemmataceae bacterium]|jgi:WD40 repeat protein
MCKLPLALVLAGALTVFGAGRAAPPLSAAKQAGDLAEKASAKGHVPPSDLHGDPLPPGALARMGTIRFAHGDSMAGYPVLAPDHKTFATVSRQTPYRQGSTVCLWDAVTGKELRHLDDPDFEPYEVFFLKRENLLGTLGISRKPVQGQTYSHAMQLWDPKTGNEAAAPLQVLGYGFEPWALSVDEKLLVSAHREPPVVVRERSTGKVLAEWTGDSKRIYSLSFTPDGKIVVIGTEAALHLWDWKANQEVEGVSGIPIQDLQRLWISPDGRWIVAALYPEGLRIWDAKKGTEVRRFAGEHDIRFFPDGKRLLSARTGAIWDIASGKQIARLDNCANCLALDISADGRSATGYALGRIRRWDTDTGKDCSPPAPTPRRIMIHQVGFLPDGKTVVAASPDGSVRIWDAASGQELRTLVTGTAWEPQHTKPILLRVATDGTIVTAQGKRLSFFTDKGKVEEIALKAERASLNLSPDGKTVLVAASDRSAQIWDAKSRKIMGHCILPEEVSLEALGVSSDRKRIAAFVNHAVVRLNASGAVEQILEKSPQQREEGNGGYSYFPGIHAFAFSPKGDVLASSGHLSTLKLLDAFSGKTRHVLTPPVPKYHQYELRNIAFSPNGSMIAAESSAGVVDVWETSTGQRRRRFLGHRSYQTALCFSPDGVRLATGNRDGTILVWDVFGLWTGNAEGAAPLTDKELPALWTRLRESDAEQAHSAMARLMQNPSVSLPFLKHRLLSRKEIETGQIRAWIADLDADDFAKRETASNELVKHLAKAEPLLKERLVNKPSVEARRRSEVLLALADSRPLSQETIGDLRALEVLEQFGVAAIGDVARQLTEGNYDPHVVSAATATLQRLKASVP